MRLTPLAVLVLTLWSPATAMAVPDAAGAAGCRGARPRR